MKYTFIKDGIAVVNGELIEQEGIEVEYNFSLKMNALKLFEMEYGKPLLKSLMNILKKVDINKLNDLANGKEDNGEAFTTSEVLMDVDFIRALSSASYVKIVDNVAYNNEVTMQEFKDSFAYDKVINDVNFVTRLLSMAMKAIFENKKSEGNSSRKK